jgi:hypothetical protein
MVTSLKAQPTKSQRAGNALAGRRRTHRCLFIATALGTWVAAGTLASPLYLIYELGQYEIYPVSQTQLMIMLECRIKSM